MAVNEQITEIKIEQGIQGTKIDNIERDVGEIKDSIVSINTHLMTDKRTQVSGLKKLLAVFLTASLAGGAIFGGVNAFAADDDVKDKTNIVKAINEALGD